uniref:calcium/sodium antiporter n=1 Tax=Thaumasiovibrio occultus TaxID=1891184 RepID=UPI000B35437F|nr:calcium/sodium antiporter [Thaumasiovibrio occultus]
MLYAAVAAVIVGFVLLIWSADKFVEGSASVATHYKMPPILIGMIIVGFGTSAPEMLVSGLAAYQGTPGIAIGNAYGSNITNIALILGMTALVMPIAVKAQILKKELSLLVFATGLSAWLIFDGQVSRIDGLVLLGVFALIMVWVARSQSNDDAGDLDDLPEMTIKKAAFWVAVGLVLLIISSQTLVWGATTIASALGVSDLMIGLTIVALGTSLPELASSIMAARKGQHDIALGNILGSNLFNTMLVVGIAAIMHPMEVESIVLTRDMLVMGSLTVLLYVLGYGHRRHGRINRFEGAFLISCYVGYIGYLIYTA